jgi:hypothetical protein
MHKWTRKKHSSSGFINSQSRDNSTKASEKVSCLPRFPAFPNDYWKNKFHWTLQSFNTTFDTENSSAKKTFPHLSRCYEARKTLEIKLSFN